MNHSQSCHQVASQKLPKHTTILLVSKATFSPAKFVGVVEFFNSFKPFPHIKVVCTFHGDLLRDGQDTVKKHKPFLVGG